MASARKVFPDPAAFKCKEMFMEERLRIWEELKSKQDAICGARSKDAISVELSSPHGNRVVAGIAFETRPVDLMPKLPSKERQQNPFVVARVFAADSAMPLGELPNADNDDSDCDSIEEEGSHAHLSSYLDQSLSAAGKSSNAFGSYTLWDLERPLEHSCRIEFVRFEDDEGKHVFWHSSAHLLGYALELEFGGYLTVGLRRRTGSAMTCSLVSAGLTNRTASDWKGESTKLSQMQRMHRSSIGTTSAQMPSSRRLCLVLVLNGL